MARHLRGPEGRILITGPSGSGKSTLCRFFRERGVNAVDGDDVRGLGAAVDLRGRRLGRITKEQWRRIEDWRFFWDEAALKRFLARNPSVVLFGASDNMFDLDLAPLFDRRIYLRASWAAIRARLNSPTRDNDWGRDAQPAQREWVRRATHDWPIRAKARGFEFVSAELSPTRFFREVCDSRAHRRRGKVSDLHVTFSEEATWNDFFWEFAQAEVQNDARHDRMYSRGLGPDLFAKVRSGRQDELDRTERSLVRSTVLSTRPEYLRPLCRLGLRWSYAELAPRDLPLLRVPDLNIFRATAPSRLLRDFASALDRGELTQWPPLAKNYRRLRTRFDPGRMVGAPIMIGTSQRGPFTIVEGVTRLSILVSRWQQGEPVPPKIPLLIGVGPKALGWWSF